MAKRKKMPVSMPVDLSDAPAEGSIDQTTVYPTIDVMFAESIAKLPWFEQYSRETRRTIRYAFVTAVAETLRTMAVAQAMNWDAAADFDKEIKAFDKELQNAEDVRSAAILGLPS